MNKALAAYALCTPAKLDVGTTMPSLCRRTDDADIRHSIHRYFRKAVLAALSLGEMKKKAVARDNVI